MARKSIPAPVLWTQYLAARLAVAAATSFNVEITHRWARQCARVAYRIDKRHRERCRQNIAFAFPEFSPQRVDELTLASFEHLGQLLLDVVHTPRRLSLDTWANHVRVKDIGPAISLLNSGRSTILVSGHLGNWEALGFILATLGYPVDALARPLDNRLINDWLLGIREKRGMRIITKFQAADRMMSVLGRGGTLAFVADQNAGAHGMYVPFFGRLASAYKSVGLLAIRKRTPIVCGCAQRIGHTASDSFRFELSVTDIIYPEDWADREDPLFYITARYTRAIETMVRRRPDQYLWMHRRWKSRPRHEREGEPMPEEMRRKLMSLPWMDEAQLRQLSGPLPASAR